MRQREQEGMQYGVPQPLVLALGADWFHQLGMSRCSSFFYAFEAAFLDKYAAGRWQTGLLQEPFQLKSLDYIFLYQEVLTVLKV